MAGNAIALQPRRQRACFCSPPCSPPLPRCRPDSAAGAAPLHRTTTAQRPLPAPPAASRLPAAAATSGAPPACCAPALRRAGRRELLGCHPPVAAHPAAAAPAAVGSTPARGSPKANHPNNRSSTTHQCRKPAAAARAPAAANVPTAPLQASRPPPAPMWQRGRSSGWGRHRWAGRPGPGNRHTAAHRALKH